MPGYEDFKNKLEEKLKNDFGKKIISSRIFRRLFKRVFLWQKDFDIKAVEEMTDFALDLTSKAFQKKSTTVWNTVFMPDEILYAAGMTPFSPEVGAGVMAAFGRADELLKEAEAEGFATDTCSFHRCAGGLELENIMPEPDMITASTHLCDGAPQLFKYFSERHEVPYYVLDVPVDEGKDAEDYLAGQIEELFELCEEIRGEKITRTKLEEVFTASNRARKYWNEAEKLRQQYPPVLTSPAALLFVYIHFLCFGATRTVEITKTLRDELENKLDEKKSQEKSFDGKPSPKPNKDRPHLLWLHLRPYFSREIFDIIDGRAEIVFEEMNHLYWPPLDPESPFRSLARKILSHQGLGPIDNRIDAIEKMISSYDIDGVIHFSHWGCRQSAGGTYKLKEHMKDLGIPFLDIQGDCVDPGGFSSGQIRTRLESFLEMLEMRYRTAGKL